MSQAVTSTRQAFARRPSFSVTRTSLYELLSPSPGKVPALETSIRLQPGVAAPRVARSRARRVCARYALLEHVVRDVEFIAGELVAISVRQTRAPLDFDVRVGGNSVTVRIRDLGGGRFARSRPDGVGTNRSLQLVQCVSQSSGVCVTADGREMWAVIPLGPRSE